MRKEENLGFSSTMRIHEVEVWEIKQAKSKRMLTGRIFQVC